MEVSLEINFIVDSYHCSYNFKKIHSTEIHYRRKYIASVHVLKKNTSNTGFPKSTSILQCILNIWNININTIPSSKLYYQIFFGFREEQNWFSPFRKVGKGGPLLCFNINPYLVTYGDFERFTIKEMSLSKGVFVISSQIVACQSEPVV